MQNCKKLTYFETEFEDLMICYILAFHLQAETSHIVLNFLPNKPISYYLYGFLEPWTTYSKGAELFGYKCCETVVIPGKQTDEDWNVSKKTNQS